ncbi:MAG TPA: hypothetical protein VFX17_00580 [Patescibacteria group bacterium]|nr:hypothetical protein [Patescibacteria group bacterium]
MNILYDVAAWGAFFMAVAGAGAALTGLVFVSITLNLQKIVGSARLVGRAEEAVLHLLSTVILSLVCLMPGISAKLTGIFVLILIIPTWIFLTDLHRRAYAEQKQENMRSFMSRFVPAQVALVPIIISGISLMAHGGGGLGWLAFGLMASVTVGVVDAWVLTIEIIR